MSYTRGTARSARSASTRQRGPKQSEGTLRLPTCPRTRSSRSPSRTSFERIRSAQARDLDHSRQTGHRGRTQKNTVGPLMATAPRSSRFARMSRVTTLVAREQELADLLAVIRDASEGNGGLVLIAGEAGVGKTRLTHEAAKASGAIVLGGGASPDGTPAYGPVVDALRAGLRLDASREFHPALTLLMPELGPPPRNA